MPIIQTPLFSQKEREQIEKELKTIADETDRKILERPDSEAELIREYNQKADLLVRERARVKRDRVVNSSWNCSVVGLIVLTIGLIFNVHQITGVGLIIAYIGAGHAILNR